MAAADGTWRTGAFLQLPLAPGSPGRSAHTGLLRLSRFDYLASGLGQSQHCISSQPMLHHVVVADDVRQRGVQMSAGCYEAW
jgi:hypothetical protein